MVAILSLLTRGKRRSQKISPMIQYHKACFTQTAAYYFSCCRDIANFRACSVWLVSVVGAPEQKAVEILDAVNRIFWVEAHVKLRWWSEAPPSYGPKISSSGKWVGYDPGRGCYDAPQKDSGAEITVLYYSDGCDPFAVLKTIPEGEYMAYYTRRMLVPVCDYVIDKESCKTVVCSEYCPLNETKSGSSRYYAPLSVRGLRYLSAALLGRGGELYTLGEINASFKTFSKKQKRVRVGEGGTVVQSGAVSDTNHQGTNPAD